MGVVLFRKFDKARRKIVKPAKNIVLPKIKCHEKNSNESSEDINSGCTSKTVTK